jgi:23S rRNA pseudouridine1911/1915/1917 synthase
MPATKYDQKLYRYDYQNAWEGKRLKQIVLELLPGLGSRTAMLVIKNGLVAPEGGKAVVDADTMIPAGTALAIDLRHGMHGQGKSKRDKLIDQFTVHYDDEHLVVVAKKAFVLVQPTDDETLSKGVRGGPPLVELLKHYWKANSKPVVSPILVQRLDLQTSGLLVMAKTMDAARLLQRQLKPPRVLEREYLALVAGEFQTDSGTWSSQLGRGKTGLRQSLGEDGQRLPPHLKAQAATTHFKVERRFPQATLLRVKLETGRTHQIRIHCAEAGHPVLGDSLYERLATGILERATRMELKIKSPCHPSQEAIRLVSAGKITIQKPDKLPRRVALHATRLSFPHPITGEKLQFEEPLPGELTHCMESYAARKV